MTKQLHIINDDSCLTTFWSSRGTSNIDITVINNQALDTVREWEISDQESCSDHSIIKYVTGNSTTQRAEIDREEVRYKVMKEDKEKFQRNLIQLPEQKFCETNVVGGTEMLDETLCSRVAKERDMDIVVEEFHEFWTWLAEAHSKFYGLQRQHRYISQFPGGQKDLQFCGKRYMRFDAGTKEQETSMNYANSEEHYT